MTSDDVDSIVRAAVLTLSNVNGDRLAARSLDTKIERHVVDEIFYAAGDLGADVRTETGPTKARRFDLVVRGVDGSYDALLEAKACYSFDVVSTTNLRNYMALLRLDAEKMLKDPARARYLLLVVTDLAGIVPAHFKYMPLQRKAVAVHGADLLAAGRTAVAAALVETFKKQPVRVTIAGQHRRCQVTTDIYLVGL